MVTKVQSSFIQRVYTNNPTLPKPVKIALAILGLILIARVAATLLGRATTPQPQKFPPKIYQDFGDNIATKYPRVTVHSEGVNKTVSDEIVLAAETLIQQGKCKPIMQGVDRNGNPFLALFFNQKGNDQVLYGIFSYKNDSKQWFLTAKYDLFKGVADNESSILIILKGLRDGELADYKLIASSQ